MYVVLCGWGLFGSFGDMFKCLVMLILVYRCSSIILDIKRGGVVVYWVEGLMIVVGFFYVKNWFEEEK